MRVIIPAAGKSIRFGGVLKELLPISAIKTPLEQAVDNALTGLHADSVVIITNAEKIGAHTAHVSKSALYSSVDYRIQVGHELWSAIKTGLEATDGALVLPDTVTCINSAHIPDAPIVFGVFKTTEASRFSVIANDTIYTKQRLDGVQRAWGIVLWNSEVAQYWLEHNYVHYDDAFRAAMNEYGYKTFDLPYYYDFGTFSAYAQYLKETTL